MEIVYIYIYIGFSMVPLGYDILIPTMIRIRYSSVKIKHLKMHGYDHSEYHISKNMELS